MSNNLRTRNGLPFNFVDGLQIGGVPLESIVIGGSSGVSFATNAETQAGTVTDKVISPSSLASVTNGLSQVSHTHSQYAPLASPVFTGIPTGPTPNPGTVNNQLATTAFVNSMLGTGSGGSVTNNSVTLSATSPAMHTITTTRHGQSVTLPDATTISEGVNIYGISNNGEYDLIIRDATGATKGFVKPLNSSSISLSDNSTPQGVWSFTGADLIGIAASKVLNLSLSIGGDDDSRFAFQSIQLDSNRNLLIFGTVTVFAIIYDKSTESWGPVALVANVPTYLWATGGKKPIAILSGPNQVLLTYIDFSLRVSAVALSVSGVSITVNTPTVISDTNADTIYSLNKTGSVFVVDYGGILDDGVAGYTRVSKLCAVTIDGTACIAGAPINSGFADIQEIPRECVVISPTLFIVLAHGESIMSNISNYVRVGSFSLSGTTISVASASNYLTDGYMDKYMVMPSGRLLVSYTTNNADQAPGYMLLEVIGTSINILSNITPFVPGVHRVANARTGFNDWARVGSDKVCCVFTGSQDNYDSAVCVLRDTNGVLSAEIISLPPLVLNNLAITGAYDSKVRFHGVLYIGGGIIERALFEVDLSATLPAFTILDTLRYSSSEANIQPPGSAALPYNRIPYRISNGTYVSRYNGNLLIGSTFNITGTESRLEPDFIATGASDRELWSITYANVVAEVSLVEMAQ